VLLFALVILMRRGPWRAARLLVKAWFSLVLAVVWLVVAISRPAAGWLLAFCALCAYLIWKTRSWWWAWVWRLFGAELTELIPDRAWMWVRRMQWPQLAWRAGLAKPLDPHPGSGHRGSGRNGTGHARGGVEHMRGRWRAVPGGFVVTGRLLDGQVPADYAQASEKLAESWQAAQVSVDSPERGWVRIRVWWVDPLAEPVPAMNPGREPDLRALVLGVEETGRPWRECLLGRHLLIAGATGAGKGSVQWSVIRAVLPLVARRIVQIWTLDAKRVEFAAGRTLFRRYACEPMPMVELMEAAAEEVAVRARAIAGQARTWLPSSGSPFLLVNIDEIAFLTAYLTDKELRERFLAALAIVLTQGRALGVCVMAAVQDPRKETLPLRQLFTTRLALRLDEPGQVDLVLGAGARDRGALAHLISRVVRDGAGIAYRLQDGDPMPRRVRAGYITDTDIARMVSWLGRQSRPNRQTGPAALIPGGQPRVMPGQRTRDGQFVTPAVLASPGTRAAAVQSETRPGTYPGRPPVRPPERYSGTAAPGGTAASRPNRVTARGRARVPTLLPVPGVPVHDVVETTGDTVGSADTVATQDVSHGR
jgi:S-DNA-T family DNA segregation ATPase FtsK/SpoIIIE